MVLLKKLLNRIQERVLILYVLKNRRGRGNSNREIEQNFMANLKEKSNAFIAYSRLFRSQVRFVGLTFVKQGFTRREICNISAENTSRPGES